MRIPIAPNAFPDHRVLTTDCLRIFSSQDKTHMRETLWRPLSRHTASPGAVVVDMVA